MVLAAGASGLLFFIATPKPIKALLESLRFVLLGVVPLACYSSWRRNRTLVEGLVVTGWLAVFASYALASAMWSVSAEYSFAKAGALVLLLLASVPAAGIVISESFHKWSRACAWGLLFTVGASALSLLGLLPGGMDGDLFRGAIGNSNDLASLVGILIPFGISEWNRKWLPHIKRSLAWRMACGSSVFAGSVFIFMSRSRAGILSFAVSVVVMGACRLIPRRWSVGVVLVGAVLFAAFPDAMMGWGKELAYKKGGAMLDSRVGTLESAAAGFGRNPILGNGFGAAVGESARFSIGDDFSTPKGMSREKTMFILGCLEELGIVGLVLLSVPLFVIVIPPVRQALKGGLSSTRAVALSVVVFGLVNANGEAWLLAPGNVLAVVWWFMAGFLAVTNVDYATSLTRGGTALASFRDGPSAGSSIPATLSSQ